MKKDISHLLKRYEIPEGFENINTAKEYVARYLLSYINIELEGLPREEWDKTLRTWAKICYFARDILSKSKGERSELYRKFNFDIVMQGIAEDVRKTLLGMLYLGLLDRKDPPHLLIPKAVELLEGEDELISRWELSTEIIKYIKEFFSHKFK